MARSLAMSGGGHAGGPGSSQISAPAPSLDPRLDARRDAWVLAGLLVLTVVLRLPRIDGPIADHLQAKQAYTALRARAIAQPPFNPFRLTLDLLDEHGRPVRLVEEVPVYCTIVALVERASGEHAAAGRIVSLIGALLAVAALYDLVRRPCGSRLAAVAATLLSGAPLFIFYGRAVMPDSGMLGLMLASAALYQRYLETGNRGTWLGAIGCAAASALFKYYGLMILVVLAGMTYRAARGWLRSLFRPRFLLLVAGIVAPVALWMGLVFLRAPNPLVMGWVPGSDPRPYLIVQQPGVLLERGFYAGLWRFLVRDLGPVAAVHLALGVVAAVRHRALPRGFKSLLVGWTVLGLGFYVVLGPKLIDHDYYELMMMPAGALWAAAGWERLYKYVTRVGGRRSARWVGGLVLGAALCTQSPWVMGGHFQAEPGKVALARAIRAAAPDQGRVVTLGPGIGLISVLYSCGRPGWTVPASRLDDDWPAQFLHFRAQDAELVALYFDSRTTATQRRSFDPLIASLPTVAHQIGPVENDRPSFEYVLMRLEEPAIRRWAARSRGPLDSLRRD